MNEEYYQFVAAYWEYIEDEQPTELTPRTPTETTIFYKA